MTSLEASPATGDRLLATAGGTLYRSEDAGESWSAALSFGIRRVAASRADPAVAYAIAMTSNTYRSLDGGVTWEPAAAVANHDLWELWSDPADPDVAFVRASQFLAFGGTFHSLRRTTDGGQTWTRSSGSATCPS